MFSAAAGGLFLLVIFHYFSPSEETGGKSARYTIPVSTTTAIYLLFAVVNIAGVLILSLLKPYAPKKGRRLSLSKSLPALVVMKLTLRLATEKRIVLLYPMFITGGLVLSFISAIYPTTIVSTLQLPIKSRVLLALSSIVLGLGSGATSCVMSTALRYQDSAVVQRLLADRRKPFVAGSIVNLAVYGLILLNFPWEAPLGRTHATGWIGQPSVALALVCSFMQGIAGACINSTAFAHIIGNYRDEENERANTIFSGVLVSFGTELLVM